MTAPRLPDIGFTDGAAVQSERGPLVFVDGAWRSPTFVSASLRSGPSDLPGVVPGPKLAPASAGSGARLGRSFTPDLAAASAAVLSGGRSMACAHLSIVGSRAPVRQDLPRLIADLAAEPG